MTRDDDNAIKVQDRRTSAADTTGDPADDSVGGRKVTAAEQRAGKEAYSEAAGSCEEPEADERLLPPVDFPTLVLSFAQSALVHLGELPHPETGEPKRNLSLARHNVDLLGMLQEKTRGNLDTDEQKLIENLLYDLRMKYVSQCKGV